MKPTEPILYDYYSCAPLDPAPTPVYAKQSRFAALWHRIALTALLAASMIGAAFAADTKPLTVGQALSMLSALRNLDGRMIVIKQNGADATIMQPWDFGSGTLRLRIAKNVTALAATEAAVETSRQNIIKELSKGLKPGASIVPNTPEWEAFMQQYADVMASPASVDLFRIKASELKLDKNEIPITAISALAPIIDDDVSPK